MDFKILAKLVGYGSHIVEPYLVEIFNNHGITNKSEIECDIYVMRYMDLISRTAYYGYRINHENIKKFLNSSGKYNYPITS